MATLLFAAGAAMLSSTLGIGGTFMATLLSSAAYLAGGLIDSWLLSTLFPPKPQNNVGPRIQDVQVTTSTEGSNINRLYGRMRLGGTVIWASRFKEVVTTTSQRVGGKGGGGQRVNTTTYTYYQSFAIALCEGPVRYIGRIWADSMEMNLTGVNYRIYYGDESQGVDPKILAVEGAAVTPAYRGLAYIVFEDLDLTKYGNRMPQITCEVFSLPTYDADSVENLIQGWDLIPGSGEFVLASNNVARVATPGSSNTASLTVNNMRGTPDFLVSLEQMARFSPNARTIALVVTWMGNDLRIGTCQLSPHVEDQTKNTTPYEWQVSGIYRSQATRVHLDAKGRPELGGTPCDKDVFNAIQLLRNQGYYVIFYPFVMMDIKTEDGKPSPYGGTQPNYPWRGRMTCDPAPGRPGTVDKTATAAAQVSNFFGSASPGQFGGWTGTTIPFGGNPAEWSFRRFILHYAKLCQQAGGVDAFLIGSEMIGMTQIRSSASTYPAIDQLVTLAGDVKSILGGTPVGYSADWSEYRNHRPADGSNDVYFHLDSLWASPNIDFIGIDWYAPVTDWRDEPNHADMLTGYKSIYDIEYLKAGMQGREDYDWYYQSQANRDAQIRTPITDGYGKPWVYRQKDLYNWWANQHINRPGGVESGGATAWVPKSKPIWFLELGAPAVDKGTNEPNVFYDPKSSESFFPRYSNGNRDDLIQQQFLKAFYAYWSNPANNPVSPSYGGPMLALNRSCVWCWDSRPYPAYPANNGAWSDGYLWWQGHWMTGRMGQVPLDKFLKHVTKDFPNIELDTTGLHGLIRGYLIAGSMSVRDMLGTLQLAFHFDAYESDGKIRFAHRGLDPKALWSEPMLVRQDDDKYPTFKMTRGQETELPQSSVIKYYDEAREYSQSTGRSSRLRGLSSRTAESQLPMVLTAPEVQAITDTSLIDAWVMREKLEFVMPPSALAYDPSDVIETELNGRRMQFRIEQIGFEYKRPVAALRTDPTIYSALHGRQSAPRNTIQPQSGSSQLVLIDSTLLIYTPNAYGPFEAASAVPWKGVLVYRSPTTSGYTLDSTVIGQSPIGILSKVYKAAADTGSGPPELTSLPPGAYGVVDHAHILEVDFGIYPGIATITTDDLYNTVKNTLLIKNPANNEWEVIQFRVADLVSDNKYRLKELIRGQLGTEHVAVGGIALGTTVIVASQALSQSSAGALERNKLLNWKFGPADRPIDDDSYQVIQFTPRAKGLRPYSPVQLAATKSGNDFSITWVRRTRINASPDGWQFDIVPPLNEVSEQYVVKIYDGSTVKREVTVTSPTFTYTAAMQTADWGALQSSISVGVAQISNVYGPGIEERKTLV